MTKRKALSLKNKLAAALLQLREPGGTELLIPYAHAKLMTADQIISLYEFHHYPIAKAHGGVDEPWNIMPLMKPEHRKETAKVTVPMVAKVKRLQHKFPVVRGGDVVETVTRHNDDGSSNVIKMRKRNQIPSRPFQKKPK